MRLKFNTDRPKVSDAEIEKHMNFDALVEQFRKRSLKQAQGDESWRAKKVLRYTTVIMGVTVVCSVTYFAFKNQKASNDKTNTRPITHKTTTRKAGSAISPPSRALAAKPAIYKVNNQAGAVIRHPGGSSISVPSNAIVNSNGEIVQGKVDISYVEFHDATDIIASGIPMRYDSAGSHFNLESAGMFSITATQNGQPVFIKPGHPLKVTLASSQPADRFNQYYLDTISRNWAYIRRDDISGGKTDLPKLRSKEKRLIADIAVIRSGSDSVTGIFRSRIAHLAAPSSPKKPLPATIPSRPSFRLDGAYNEFPELSVFQNVLFEVGTENTNYSPELHEITWSDVKISNGPQKGVNYFLDLSYRTRHERLVVYPVLSAADHAKAQQLFDARLEQYQAKLQQREAQQRQLEKELQDKQDVFMAKLQAKTQQLEETRRQLAEASLRDVNFSNQSNQQKVLRVFDIARFGIFNSDCPHPLPPVSKIVPVFSFDTRSIRPDAVFVVDHTINTVTSLEAGDGFRLPIHAGHAISLCVFNGTRLYFCNRKETARILAYGGKEFPVQEVSDLQHPADLRKALAM